MLSVCLPAEIPGLTEEQKLMMIGRFMMQPPQQQQQMQQQQPQQRQQMAPNTPPHGAGGGISMAPGAQQVPVGAYRQASVSLPHTPIKYNENLVQNMNNAINPNIPNNSS